jgi:glutamate synthase (NADPH/NADH) large chain
VTAVVEGVGDHALEYMTGGLAVILGSTGRNIGAGMSGGIAFVLDLEPALVNSEMVDLDPVVDEDDAVLRALVARHAEETQSSVAEELLADWPTARGRFTKVMPREYKRVLRARADAEARGLDPLVAVMGGTNG